MQQILQRFLTLGVRQCRNGHQNKITTESKINTAKVSNLLLKIFRIFTETLISTF
jgi:hypothetical protein